jgi:hypothetical protein
MRKRGLMEATSVFLFDEFLHLANKTSGGANDTILTFYGKNGPKSPHYQEMFF